MKPRIKVRYDLKFMDFLVADSETVRPLVWEYEDIKFQSKLDELTRFPTFHFSTVEMALYAIVTIVFVVASLSWAIYEVSKL